MAQHTKRRITSIIADDQSHLSNSHHQHNRPSNKKVITANDLKEAHDILEILNERLDTWLVQLGLKYPTIQQFGAVVNELTMRVVDTISQTVLEDKPMMKYVEQLVSLLPTEYEKRTMLDPEHVYDNLVRFLTIKIFELPFKIQNRSHPINSLYPTTVNSQNLTNDVKCLQDGLIELFGLLRNVLNKVTKRHDFRGSPMQLYILSDDMLLADWMPLSWRINYAFIAKTGKQFIEPGELVLSQHDIQHLPCSPSIYLKGIKQCKHFTYRARLVADKSFYSRVSNNLIEGLFQHELLIIELDKVINLTDIMSMGNYLSIVELSLSCMSMVFIEEFLKCLDERLVKEEQALNRPSVPLLSTQSTMQALITTRSDPCNVFNIASNPIAFFILLGLFTMSYDSDNPTSSTKPKVREFCQCS